VKKLSLVLLSLAAAGCNCNPPPSGAPRCTANADCPSALVCNTLDATCVQCVEDQNCPSGTCLPDGTCAMCGPAQPCPQGQTCGADGLCTNGCDSATAGCPMGKYCLPGSATCVECTMDSQCGPNRICDALHICRGACTSPSMPCAQGTVCDADAGVCVGCLSNANCSMPPVCDPVTRTCVGCLSGSDCNGALAVCNPGTQTCVGCVADGDCGTGQVCKNNSCVPGCSAQHTSCLNNLVCDTASGTCVTCTTDAQCGGATPRCDTVSHSCKPCLSGASDNCPMGEYCRPDFVCERGCKTNAECPSGQCVNHSCAGCTNDAQCAAGLVCQNGTCISSCSATNPCGAGKDCCNQHCVDLQSDNANCMVCGQACNGGQTCCGGQCLVTNTAAHCGACGTVCGMGQDCCNGGCTAITTAQNCGACGVACGADHFCDGTTCQAVVFPNFCANKNVYAIYDTHSLDDSATNVLASTILQNCSMSTTVVYGPETNPAWVDQDAGTLLLGAGSTVVTAGGPYANNPVKWMELTEKSTKVYFAFSSDGLTFYFKKRSDDSVVAMQPLAMCNTHNDVLLLELTTDPVTGTLALIGYGVCAGGYGTQAAAWFYANVMLPNRMSYPDSWYLFQWTDGPSMDAQPGMDDTFTKLASGQ
jgi:Cys-rich repeat protein